MLTDCGTDLEIELRFGDPDCAVCGLHRTTLTKRGGMVLRAPPARVTENWRGAEGYAILGNASAHGLCQAVVN